MVLETLTYAHREPPHSLRNAHDRMTPMLRFFRHGDGALALFNDGLESDPAMITELLARDQVRGALFSHARHSGYHRLAAGRALVLMDCGKVPEGDFARDAHAGFGAIEFSVGGHRMVVNCGAGGPANRGWRRALRATAAHSTLILADSSSARILPDGLAHTLLGPRLLGGPQDNPSSRSETDKGWTVEAAHDAWANPFGIRHERRITLSPNGAILTGADRLVPVSHRASRAPLPFAVRFHIHPDVRISRLEGGGILPACRTARAGGSVPVARSGSRRAFTWAGIPRSPVPSKLVLDGSAVLVILRRTSHGCLNRLSHRRYSDKGLLRPDRVSHCRSASGDIDGRVHVAQKQPCPCWQGLGAGQDPPPMARS